MKTVNATARIAGAALAVMFFAAHAHHATSAYYHVDRTAQITGAVKDYRLLNPHLRLEIEVTAEGGEIQNWIFEGPVAGDLRRRGWTPDSLEPGEIVTVTYNPARNQNFHGGHVVNIIKADGTSLTYGSLD